MDQEKKTTRATKRASANKKPYTKPTCTSEPIYETLALACGKTTGQGGSCNAAPRNS
jgi:hypothetical protein